MEDSETTEHQDVAKTTTRPPSVDLDLVLRGIVPVDLVLKGLV